MTSRYRIVVTSHTTRPRVLKSIRPPLIRFPWGFVRVVRVCFRTQTDALNTNTDELDCLLSCREEPGDCSALGCCTTQVPGRSTTRNEATTTTTTRGRMRASDSPKSAAEV